MSKKKKNSKSKEEVKKEKGNMKKELLPKPKTSIEKKTLFQKVRNIFSKSSAKDRKKDILLQSNSNSAMIDDLKKRKEKKKRGEKERKKEQRKKLKALLLQAQKKKEIKLEKGKTDVQVVPGNLSVTAEKELKDDQQSTDIGKQTTENGKKKTEDGKLFNVTEIFYSIQGESSLAGTPTVFIRLQGCNLRCSWCDTGYALNVKKERMRLSAEKILKKVKKYDCKHVCITGGEPLLQKNVPELLSILCNSNYIVSLETNGFYSLENINKKVIKIVDFKCPGSKMQSKNDFSNIAFLTKNDEVKFVIKDKVDYKWSKEIINKFNLADKVNTILFSPVFGKLETKELSNWVINDKLKARVQIQLHKYIWNPKKRGV